MVKNRDQLKLDEVEIIRLYTQELLSIEEIRIKFNVNYATIRLRLLRNNVKLRSHSESKKILMNRPDMKEKISMASKTSSDKRIETNIQKYGTAVPCNNTEKRKEWEEEYIRKNKVSYKKDPVRTQKIKDTSIKRYNVSNPSQTEDSKEKIKRKRWVDKTRLELQSIRDKTIKTWQNNLQVDNPLKHTHIKSIVKKKRWEDKTPNELDQILQKSRDTIRDKSLPKVLEHLKHCKLTLLEDFISVKNFINLKCTTCNTEFQSVLDYILHGYGLCPVCFPKNESKWECEVKDFIGNVLINDHIEKNNRKILNNNKELDIYIPSKNIAIECDGLYYHSDARTSQPEKYHLEKTMECNRKGIQLIHIFEDEWVHPVKKNIIQHRLLQILGISKAEKLNGRDCFIENITGREKNIFLNDYHLQGSDNSIVKLGAFHQDILVAVMTFSKGNISKGSKSIEGVWELNRYASNYNYNVRGIAGKLLSYFKKNFDWKEIFTYADLRWSNGTLYKLLGFNELRQTKPNYWYVKGLQRIHRFNLRKKSGEPNNIPEWVLRQGEGYYRIWDCGHLKFNINNEENSTPALTDK